MTKSEVDKLNEFLIKVATTDAGIRRKILAINQYINQIGTNNKNYD